MYSVNRSSNIIKSGLEIVSRVAAEFLIRNLDEFGTQAKSFVEYFASDKSGSVSERGRFALKQLEKTS